MAYTINLTDGTVFATIADGTVNTSSSMVLVGKNYAGYGEFLDENFIHLLENGANTTAPAAPLTGQLWWDKSANLLKVYNGSVFKSISGATASSSQPTSNIAGDLWYDTVNQQLKVFTGSGYIVVGPAFTSAQGTTGAVPETINDSGGSPHFITSLYVNNVRVAIVSRDANFTPAAPIVTVFPTVFTGMTLATSGLGGSAVFGGSATNAQLLDNLDSTDFMRATANTSTTGTLRVGNNAGLTVGQSNAAVLFQNNSDAVLRSSISNGNLVLQANVGGTIHNVATAFGGNGVFSIGNSATVGSTLTVTGNVAGGNLTTSSQVSATGNITGGNILTSALVRGTTVSATGNVVGGNVTTTGIVSATGTITSAANVSAQFFIGNGSQLTGLSSAVSVTKIVNGTSNAEIGTTGGNLRINIGGVANVVVVDTSTVYANILNVNNITTSGVAAGNIGSASNPFNRVFAQSTTALYADVAERFAADEAMDAGTVVELGGTKEITRAQQALSENVFGVISTRAAYLMNGGAGDDSTHPPVAMTGRVPVKAIGVVRKGDRLVSAGNGFARAAQRDEITPFNVIGRALADKLDSTAGEVEAIVTISK